MPRNDPTRAQPGPFAHSSAPENSFLAKPSLEGNSRPLPGGVGEVSLPGHPQIGWSQPESSESFGSGRSGFGLSTPSWVPLDPPPPTHTLTCSDPAAAGQESPKIQQEPERAPWSSRCHLASGEGGPRLQEPGAERVWVGAPLGGDPGPAAPWSSSPARSRGCLVLDLGCALRLALHARSKTRTGVGELTQGAPRLPGPPSLTAGTRAPSPPPCQAGVQLPPPWPGGEVAFTHGARGPVPVPVGGARGPSPPQPGWPGRLALQLLQDRTEFLSPVSWVSWASWAGLQQS